MNPNWQPGRWFSVLEIVVPLGRGLRLERSDSAIAANRIGSVTLAPDPRSVKKGNPGDPDLQWRPLRLPCHEHRDAISNPNHTIHQTPFDLA